MALAALRKALPKAEEIKITVVGRTSGRKITLPVWFVADGRTLYLLPVRGSDTQWYGNLLKRRSIVLTAGRARWKAKEIRLIKSRARVRKIADMFREKYGAGDVRKYYSKLDVAVRIPLG